MKIEHGAILENIVSCMYAKFDNDRLQNEKALGLTTTRRTETMFIVLGDPFHFRGLRIYCSQTRIRKEKWYGAMHKLYNAKKWPLPAPTPKLYNTNVTNPTPPSPESIQA